MKGLSIIGLCSLLVAIQAACIRAETINDRLGLAPAGSVQLHGWIGDKIDLCLSNRVMRQDIGRLIKPFVVRQEKDGSGWRCEYWGKWFTSAALGYGYQPTAENRAVLNKAVRDLLATQTPDGYIGTYRADCHLGIWDVWGRKYVLLGLIAAYDQSGDRATLDAACRAADHLLAEAPPGKVNITATGIDVLKGLAPSSILEPMVLLYRRTGQQKYLDFANAIVADWGVSNKFTPHGLRLVENALAGVPPLKLGSPKAYEMMSCFEGLCELYRVTGQRCYRDAAVKFGQSIRQAERMADFVRPGTQHIPVVRDERRGIGRFVRHIIRQVNVGIRLQKVTVVTLGFRQQHIAADFDAIRRRDVIGQRDGDGRQVGGIRIGA